MLFWLLMLWCVLLFFAILLLLHSQNHTHTQQHNSHIAIPIKNHITKVISLFPHPPSSKLPFASSSCFCLLRFVSSVSFFILFCFVSQWFWCHGSSCWFSGDKVVVVGVSDQEREREKRQKMEFGSGSPGDHHHHHDGSSDSQRRKKRYHRHTANQIQRLES